MTETTLSKAEVLERIQAEWKQFAELLASLTDAQKADPCLPGGWTVKDLLAHLTAWERALGTWIEAANEGRDPGIPRFTDEYVNGINAQVYAENRTRPYADVYEDYLKTHDEFLIPQFRALPDDPADPRWSVWRDRRPPWLLVEGNTYGHFCEHADALRACFQHEA